MVSKAVASAALLLWLLVVFKFVGTVRSRSAPARWLLATVAFLATGITIFVPSVEQWVVNGQVEVPAGGHVKVPTPCG